MGVLVQVLATIIVCFPCLNMGVICSWPSSTILLFTSPNTTLSRQMTAMEVSVFGSMSTIGAMVGTLVAAALLDRLGRKHCTILAGMTSVVAWGIIASTSSIEVLLIAVFISGLSGASFLIVPVYVSEFCQESIRGTMTSGSMVFYGVGTLVSYLLGAGLSYRMMIYVAMAVNVLQVLAMGWLEESPVYLMKNGLRKEATKSIAFYRQVEDKSKIVRRELSSIHRSLSTETSADSFIFNTINLLSEPPETPKVTKIYTFEEAPPRQSAWQFFKNSKPTQRGLVITIGLMLAAVFQGMLAVIVYAEPLFTEAVPDVSASLCSILLAVSIMVASLVAAYLSDIAGRRPLMTYSSIGAGVCCIFLGSQIQFHWGPGWATVVIMYTFCAVYSFGSGTVPFVLLAEVFLPEVKSFMTMLVVEWMWICNSLMLLIFNPLISVIGLGPMFYLFAAICFLSAVFSVFYIPETKGLTLDVVQKLLTKKLLREEDL